MMPRKSKRNINLENNKVEDANRKRLRDYRLEILGLFQADAADIIAARTRSQFIHRGGNIRSAGDEVETAVRNYFRRRLPLNYTIHHGHFIDHTLSLSPQMDIIIADHGRFPVFFRGQEGLEYLPYEGVYAYGEIKSKITNQHVVDFVERNQSIRLKMKRAKVPDGYIDKMEEVEPGILAWQPWSERGDAYNFLFGVCSDEFDIDRCQKFLCDIDQRDAPRLICLLDQGVIVSGRARQPDGELVATYIHPHKTREPKTPFEMDGWVFSEPTSEYKEGANLFYSYVQLIEHLKNNVLLQTNYEDYIKKIVRLNTKFIHRRDKL